MDKEKWHKFYIANKDNFTDSEYEAENNKSKILIKKYKERKSRNICDSIFHSILTDSGDSYDYYN